MAPEECWKSVHRGREFPKSFERGILKPVDPSRNTVVPERELSHRIQGEDSRGEVRILHGVQMINGVSHSGLQGPGF